jgi:hypothetical protein
MRRQNEEAFLVQALDARIRTIVEQVLSKVLSTRATRSSLEGISLVRSATNGVAKGANGRRRGRGRPRKDHGAEIQGKIVKTVSTPQGSVIYTGNEKYLKQRNGSIIKISHIRGSLEPARAMGYSSSQYQLARRYNWPMPCPIDFEPPPRARRGRRPRARK